MTARISRRSHRHGDVFRRALQREVVRLREPRRILAMILLVLAFAVAMAGLYARGEQAGADARAYWTGVRPYRSEMKGLNWDGSHNQVKDGLYDTARLEDEIRALLIDDDVTRRKGIYYYVLTTDEKYLSIRQLTEAQRREACERQAGICPRVRKAFRDQ